MKSIEFFGAPCSGKSYECYKMKIKLIRKNHKIYTTRELILNNFHLIKDMSINYKLAITYFKFINTLKKTKVQNFSSFIYRTNKSNKNIIYRNNILTKSTNKFKKDYENICHKIYLKYIEKNKKLDDFVKNVILKNTKDKSKKRNYKFWIEELCAANYLKQKLNNKRIILLQDEGLIQRSYILLNIKIKNKIFYLKKFLELIPFSDKIYYKKSKISEIIKFNTIRKKMNNVWIYKSKNEIKKYKSYEKKIYEILKLNGKKILPIY